MKVGRKLGAVLVIAAGVWVVLPASPASAAPIADVCVNGTTVGTTFTLTADCVTTVPLVVPDGFTVDGAGFTITARDPATGPFDGAVLSNAAGATTMNVVNLTIVGEFGSPAGSLLTGIFFVEAGGTVNNVTVQGMTRHSGAQQGLGIRANAIVGPARTVAITDTTVSGYQKGGLVASGAFMTMDVSGSIIGPPDELTALNAQNGVQFGGAAGGTGGSLTTSTIHGSGFTGNTTTDGTAVLLFAAANVTISGNSIVGAGTDVGIFLAQNSTGVTIEDNDITRSSANTPDKSGIGVNVPAGSSATLTCNTFSGWVTNLVGATQAPCITTTSLPGGTVGSPYSATLVGNTPNPPLTWSASGLPPGLTLAADGTISGTPTTPGTFSFTVTATDSTGAAVTRDLSITIADVPPQPPPSAGAWEPLGGLVLDSPAAASWGAGRLHVVVRGVDTQLWHKWFEAGSWSGWEPLGGLTTAGPATTAWSAGRLDIFVNGLDGQLWHKWWDGAWSDWVPLGGLVVDSPAAASWGPGRLDVVVQGADAQLWHKWFDGGSWSAWEPLGGLTAAGPATTSWSAGRLDVFVNGLDGQLWHKGWEGAWSDWVPLGGLVLESPAAASGGPGRLDVVVRGADNQPWHKWFDAGTWSAWEALGGLTTAGPAVASSSAGQLDVFVNGLDGQLWHRG